MKRGLEWYKREPRAIIDAKRAARMTCRQAAMYDLVLDLIYEGGGETPDDPKYFAGHFSDIGIAAARRTVDDLIVMGKLIREGGMLTQKRAKNEAKTRENLRKTRANSGRIGAERRWDLGGKPNDNNDDGMACAINDAMPEKRREEKKEPPLPPKGNESVEEEFEEWWKHVPRKVGKGAARRAFKTARKKADMATLRSAIRAFALSVQHKDAQFICHPSSWLNGERWSDQEGVDIPAMQATDAELLAQRVERAEGWLARHATIAGHMDRRDVADALIARGHDYEKLREAGFSLPPSGKVIELGGRRDGQHASG